MATVVELRGNVDSLEPESISGWAVNLLDPMSRVEVCLLVNGRVLAKAICQQHRPDLLRAGVPGDGYAGFTFTLPASIRRDEVFSLSVVDSRTGMVLPRGARTLKSRDHARNRPAPLLVTGSGRSGTTLLMSRLAASSQINIAPGYPFETLMIAYYANLHRVLTRHAERDEFKDPNISSDLRLVGPNPFFDGKWYWSAFKDRRPFVEHFCGTIPTSLHDVFRASIYDYYDLVAAETHKIDATYFCEKNQGVERYSREFARTLSPATREIILTRDPRDLYVSQAQRFGTDPDQLIDFIDRDCRALVDIAARASADLLIVRYEDLILQPDREIDRVAAFLDVAIPTPNVALEREQFRQHATSGSPAASVGRWAKTLDPDVVRAIRRRCNAFFGTFEGYD